MILDLNQPFHQLLGLIGFISFVLFLNILFKHKFTAPIFGGFFLLIISTLISFLTYHINQKPSFTHTSGIVKSNHEWYNEDGSTYYYPTLSISLEGEQSMVACMNVKSVSGFHEGEKVAIMFKNNDPIDAKIYSFFYGIILPLTILFFGISCFLSILFTGHYGKMLFPEKGNKNPIALLGETGILLTVGIFFLTIASSFIKKEISIFANYSVAQGYIQNYKTTTSKRKSGKDKGKSYTYYTPVIGYQVYGKEYTITSRNSSRKISKIDQKVKIYFNRKFPGNATSISIFHFFLISFFITSAGLLCIYVAFRMVKKLTSNSQF